MIVNKDGTKVCWRGGGWGQPLSKNSNHIWIY